MAYLISKSKGKIVKCKQCTSLYYSFFKPRHDVYGILRGYIAEPCPNCDYMGNYADTIISPVRAKFIKFFREHF